MTSLRPISPDGFTYDHIIGIGGIGSGMFFSLKDDHTLGRNESRMAKLQPWKDYCKQHIILHYVSVLLGSGATGFKTWSLGKVGNDAAGANLVGMMKAAGINTQGVQVLNDYPTLFSVCFQYPDSSGGNISTENGASSQVSVDDVQNFFSGFEEAGQRGIALAVPEVPVSSRAEFLKLAKQRNYFTVASVLSGEVNEFVEQTIFRYADLLSVNIDEAAAIAGVATGEFEASEIVRRCVEKLLSVNSDVSVIVTAGSEGSYCYQLGKLVFTPAVKVRAVSTAGAGDAFLAGTIAGLCCGLPLIKQLDNNLPAASAVELGGLLAALSVTSPDTIHIGADARSLYDFVSAQPVLLEADFKSIFLNAYTGDTRAGKEFTKA